MPRGGEIEGPGASGEGGKSKAAQRGRDDDAYTTQLPLPPPTSTPYTLILVHLLLVLDTATLQGPTRGAASPSSSSPSCTPPLRGTCDTCDRITHSPDLGPSHPPHPTPHHPSVLPSPTRPTQRTDLSPPDLHLKKRHGASRISHVHDLRSRRSANDASSSLLLPFTQPTGHTTGTSREPSATLALIHIAHSSTPRRNVSPPLLSQPVHLV
jgi:hypothetical protein